MPASVWMNGVKKQYHFEIMRQYAFNKINIKQLQQNFLHLPFIIEKFLWIQTTLKISGHFGFGW